MLISSRLNQERLRRTTAFSLTSMTVGKRKLPFVHRLAWNASIVLLRSLSFLHRAGKRIFCGHKKARRKSAGTAGNWLRGQDLNLRPSGYEPDELPGCSTPRSRQRLNNGLTPSLCKPFYFISCPAGASGYRTIAEAPAPHEPRSRRRESAQSSAWKANTCADSRRRLRVRGSTRES